MIGTLRRKFVFVVMVLVGAVLAVSLGSSLLNFYTTQWGMVDRTLKRALEEDFPGGLPVIGGSQRSQAEDARAGRPVAWVTVDSSGLVLASSSDVTSVDQDVLSRVIDAALASEKGTGCLSDCHVAWASAATSDGSLRIAVADTADVEGAFQSQLATSAVIFLVALLALFAIAVALANWMLGPVREAWAQQRRFVADASHELKTPLAVIVANMGILQRDQSLPAEDRRWVDGSVEAASQMQGLVGDLLELARTDETKAGDADAMRRVDVDLSDLVESAALEFDAVAFERGCTIDARVEPGIHLVGDPAWLERMTRTLIDNAVKYAAAGTTVVVSLAQEQGHTRLLVNNRGDVIAPDDLAHVFDRFYRSDAARSRATGGFGLGLAIAKGVAEAHGGSIGATSTQADGTTFRVTL